MLLLLLDRPRRPVPPARILKVQIRVIMQDVVRLLGAMRLTLILTLTMALTVPLTLALTLTLTSVRTGVRVIMLIPSSMGLRIPSLRRLVPARLRRTSISTPIPTSVPTSDESSR